MTLYSSPFSCYSHRVRMVLAEKGVSADIRNVDPDAPPEDLLDLSPYNSVPTLVDRELVLYDSRVIIEYLDERFPHPPLLPVDPVNRARFRLALTRIETDWYSLLEKLDHADDTERSSACRALHDSLTASAALFAAKPFFLSEEFSLVDCSIAPLLWRLSYFGIELPPQAYAITEYGQKLFGRASFLESLSPYERELRSQHF